MQPMLVIMSAISIAKGAPHPNAAKLFIDFVLSEEAQKLFRDADYIPSNPTVAPSDPTLRPNDTSLKVVYMTPEDLDGSMPQWKRPTFDDLFR